MRHAAALLALLLLATGGAGAACRRSSCQSGCSSVTAGSSGVCVLARCVCVVLAGTSALPPADAGNADLGDAAVAAPTAAATDVVGARGWTPLLPAESVEASTAAPRRRHDAEVRRRRRTRAPGRGAPAYSSEGRRWAEGTAPAKVDAEEAAGHADARGDAASDHPLSAPKVGSKRKGNGANRDGRAEEHEDRDRNGEGEGKRGGRDRHSKEKGGGKSGEKGADDGDGGGADAEADHGGHVEHVEHREHSVEVVREKAEADGGEGEAQRDEDVEERKATDEDGGSESSGGSAGSRRERKEDEDNQNGPVVNKKEKDNEDDGGNKDDGKDKDEDKDDGKDKDEEKDKDDGVGDASEESKDGDKEEKCSADYVEDKDKDEGLSRGEGGANKCGHERNDGEIDESESTGVESGEEMNTTTNP